MNQNLVKLRKFLDKRFDLDEIKTLCFDLSVDFDNLEGNTKTAKIRELILLYQRNEKVPDLVAQIKELRPSSLLDPIFEELKGENLRKGRSNSNILNYPYEDPFTLFIQIGKNRKLVQNDDEILALTEEAIFAFTNERQIVAEVYLEDIDIINRSIATLNHQKNLTSDERRFRVEQMYRAKDLEKRRDNLQEGLQLLFQYIRSLIPVGYRFAKPDKIAKVISNLAVRSLLTETEFLNAGGLGIHLMLKEDSRNATIIYLNEKEADQLRSNLPKKYDGWLPYPDLPDVIVNMMSTTGLWDVFDLGESTIVNKAIPAIITRTVWAYRDRETLKMSDLEKYLDIHNWYIGLA